MYLQQTLRSGSGWIYLLRLERVRDKGRQQKRVQVGYSTDGLGFETVTFQTQVKAFADTPARSL
jgi:hypothetical protein